MYLHGLPIAKNLLLFPIKFQKKNRNLNANKEKDLSIDFINND